MPSESTQNRPPQPQSLNKLRMPLLQRLMNVYEPFYAFLCLVHTLLCLCDMFSTLFTTERQALAELKAIEVRHLQYIIVILRVIIVICCFWFIVFLSSICRIPWRPRLQNWRQSRRYPHLCLCWWNPIVTNHVLCVFALTGRSRRSARMCKGRYDKL